MRWWCYELLMRALQPWLRRKLRRRAQTEPLYGQWVEQRFGHYAGPSPRFDLWIHAVSLGEARAAGVLLAALRRQAVATAVETAPLSRTGLIAGLGILATGGVLIGASAYGRDLGLPTFAAGPIERTGEFASKLARAPLPWSERVLGLERIVVGLGKKLLVGDRLLAFAEPVFADPSSASRGWNPACSTRSRRPVASFSSAATLRAASSVASRCRKYVSAPQAGPEGDALAWSEMNRSAWTSRALAARSRRRMKTSSSRVRITR